MNNQITLGSQSDIAKRNNMSLAETFLNVDLIALVDISGSMASRDAQGGKSRWDIANQHLTNLQGLYQGKIALIEFASTTMFKPDGILSVPNGSTNLTDALQFVKVADSCGIKIVVVSDGVPDNPKTVLNEAKKYTSKIDVIYCGDENDYEGGRAFLQKLANVTGGQFFKSDSTGSIETEIEILLLGG
jgi:hypothetical protein